MFAFFDLSYIWQQGQRAKAELIFLILPPSKIALSLDWLDCLRTLQIDIINGKIDPRKIRVEWQDSQQPDLKHQIRTLQEIGNQKRNAEK